MTTEIKRPLPVVGPHRGGRRTAAPHAPRGGHPGARATDPPGVVERAGVDSAPAALPREHALRGQHVSGGAAVFVLAAVAGLAGLAASALGDAGAGLVWAVVA